MFGSNFEAWIDLVDNIVGATSSPFASVGSDHRRFVVVSGWRATTHDQSSLGQAAGLPVQRSVSALAVRHACSARSSRAVASTRRLSATPATTKLSNANIAT